MPANMRQFYGPPSNSSVNVNSNTVDGLFYNWIGITAVAVESGPNHLRGERDDAGGVLGKKGSKECAHRSQRLTWNADEEIIMLYIYVVYLTCNFCL